MPKIDRTTVAMVVLVPLASFPSTHRSRGPCMGAGEGEGAHSRKVGPGDLSSAIGEIVSLHRFCGCFVVCTRGSPRSYPLLLGQSRIARTIAQTMPQPIHVMFG
jgi:hypothetical protein